MLIIKSVKIGLVIGNGIYIHTLRKINEGTKPVRLFLSVKKYDYDENLFKSIGFFLN